MKKIKKNQKGFTLVEIIVVLVILAILAAAAIPTMLGFVDDAKGKSEIANARAAYVAAQSIATETFATSTKTADADKDADCVIAITDTKIADKTGMDADKFDVVKTGTAFAITKGKITTFTYSGETHNVEIKDGKVSISKKVVS